MLKSQKPSNYQCLFNVHQQHETLDHNFTYALKLKSSSTNTTMNLFQIGMTLTSCQIYKNKVKYLSCFSTYVCMAMTKITSACHQLTTLHILCVSMKKIWKYPTTCQLINYKNHQILSHIL